MPGTPEAPAGHQMAAHKAGQVYVLKRSSCTTCVTIVMYVNVLPNTTSAYVRRSEQGHAP